MSSRTYNFELRVVTSREVAVKAASYAEARTILHGWMNHAIPLDYLYDGTILQSDVTVIKETFRSIKIPPGQGPV